MDTRVTFIIIAGMTIPNCLSQLLIDIKTKRKKKAKIEISEGKLIIFYKIQNLK